VDNANSYDDVIKILEELSEDNWPDGVDIRNHLDDNHKSFRFEYAFESLTEKGSKFRKRVSHA
jgi:hypothetical protein